MKTEYLITFDSSDHICSNVEKFKNLLTSHTSISFHHKSTINFNEIEFQYQLALGNLTDGSIYFDLTLESNNTAQYEQYAALLKEIRRICTKISNRNIITLHDGIGESYCQLGYPIIFKTENLMRKLIAKFMAISIGYDWTDVSTPKEVLDSVRSEGKKERSNFLQEIDFIQLSTFLFKKYTKTDSSRFFDSLKEKNDNDTINVIELKQYVPFTNWEKYFSKKVNCDSEYLRSRWERLYDYRCKIAHCKGLAKHEYDDLESISNDICDKIQAALDSIGDIHIEEDEREELAENFSGAANERAADFIAKYNQLTSFLQLICDFASNDTDIYNKAETNKTNVLMQSMYLCNNKGIIENEISNSIIEAQKFRNKIVHQVGITEVSEVELVKWASTLDAINNGLAILNVDDIAKLKGVDLRKRE